MSTQIFYAYLLGKLHFRQRLTLCTTMLETGFLVVSAFLGVGFVVMFVLAVKLAKNVHEMKKDEGTQAN